MKNKFRPKWLFRLFEFGVLDVLSVACYFIYEDWIFAMLTSLVLGLFFHFYVLKRWMTMRKTIQTKKEMAFWMNSLVVQTSVTPSLVSSVEAMIPLLPAHLQQLVVSTEQQSITLTLEPLIYYFNHPHYTMFHRLLEIYVERGGQLVAMSRQILLSVAQEQQDFYRLLSAYHRRLRELSTGWLFTMVALVYLKFLLPSFYSTQLADVFFKFAIIVNFVLIGYSYYLFFKHYRPLNMDKGWELE